MGKKKNMKRDLKKELTTKTKKSFQINANELNWKPVEIPDTLDDFEGFYGLEEIDNVDVKIINGKVHFSTKDENNKISENEIKNETNVAPEGDFELDPEDINEEDIKNINDSDDEEIEEEVKEDEEDHKEESDKEEIKEKSEVNSDIEDQIESSKEKGKINKKNTVKITNLVLSKDQNDEMDVPQLPEEKKKPTTSKNKQQEVITKEELKQNTFAQLNDIEIPTDEVDLPEWSDIPLSSSTLVSLQKLGFKKPTEIQKQTIPVSLSEKDVIGKAITGSGKTMAYGIPILEKSLSTKSDNLPKEYANHPTAIIFTPTRELANQVMKNLRELFKYSPFSDKTVTSLTGGLSIQKQERLLSYNPKVLVATPGRCLEILEKSSALAKKLASIDILVLDEADRMLQDGHFDEMKKILEILNNYRPKNIGNLPRRWQSLIFSATFSKDLFGKLDSHKKQSEQDNKKKRKRESDDDSEIKEVLEILGNKLHFRAKPAYIDVNPTEVVANKISEAMIPCSPMERDLMLYYFVSVFPGTTLVFTNSIDSVKRLAPTLNNLGIPTVSIHSSMIQKQRLRALERFTKNSEIARSQHKSSVLIASDVAARGLDIKGIQHVIHYHLPRTADAYVHRSGRTARAGNEGVSVVLCSPQEASGPLRKLRTVIAKTDKIEEIKMLPVDVDILGQLKVRLNLAAKIAQAEVASQSVQKEKNWLDKAADDLGVDGLSDFEDDFLRRDRKRKEGKTMEKHDIKIAKAELKASLKKPIRKNGRRSYIAGGLNNIAQLLLNNEGNDSIVGYLQQDALQVLKSSKSKLKKQKTDS